MDLTEHLTCTGGAELPGGRAGGLPARPHHPARHGSLPPASPPPSASALRASEWGRPPGRREEKGVCCRPDPLQLPEFSHLILQNPLGDGYYYDCPLPLSSAAQRREARGHHESAPGFEPSAAAGLPARRPIPSRVSGQRCALRSQARSSGPARGGGGGGDGAAQSRPPPRRG